MSTERPVEEIEIEPAPEVAEDEPPVPTTKISEADRKKAIRKNMAGNAETKEHGKRETNAGRRDPRSQPDFEDKGEPEPEESE